MERRKEVACESVFVEAEHWVHRGCGGQWAPSTSAYRRDFICLDGSFLDNLMCIQSIPTISSSYYPPPTPPTPTDSLLCNKSLS